MSVALAKRAFITQHEQTVITNLRLIEREYRVAVLNAITAARRAPGTAAQLARLISSGQVDRAIAEAARVGAISLADQYAAVYTQVGRETATALTKVLDVAVSFDQVNERAVGHVRRERFRLIREFTDEQRRATRTAMTDGVERGLNPRAQAREFRRSIGLTQKQQQSVINYRGYLERAASGDRTALSRQLRDRRFDPSIRRAMRSGEPLTDAQIDRMTQRYRERYVKYRSEVIARTEALRAANTAARETMDQAIEDGHMQREELERTWVTAIDGRERESHRQLDTMVRGVDEPFPGLFGDILYPGDPGAPPEETIQCRCTLAIRVKRTVDSAQEI